MRAKKLFKKLIRPVFNTDRTRQLFYQNPTIQPERKDVEPLKVCVYQYNATTVNDVLVDDVAALTGFRNTANVKWINVDGIEKEAVEAISQQFEIHPLIGDDILSKGQRPKMDEIEDIVYGLLNMLYFNNETSAIETEQISIVLGRDFVITFQEDPKRDVFNSLREKLKLQHSKLRQKGADYLCYSLLDMIVDHYFVVMESLGDKIELLEEEIIRQADVNSLAKINNLRKELIVLRRNVTPVRDLVNGYMKSDSVLIDESVKKYFKDVYDHSLQANDFVENYRDMLNNLQDLYLSKVNLRLNEVMKVIAVVTCLLAPATVIGGIFGMNFDVIPFQHSHWAFYSTVAFMLLVVPGFMLFVFKKRGWF